MKLITKKGNTFHEVKNSLSITDVVTRLGAQLNSQSKNTLVGTCPVGHPSSSKKSFHVDNHKQLCHCFNCGMGGDVFSVVEAVKKISKWEALKWLVEEFDLKIDTSQHQHIPRVTPEEISERDELRSRSFLLEEIVERGKQLLFQDEGKDALEYLVNERKYDSEIIKKTEWFYLPEEQDVKMELIEKDEERKAVVGKLKLQGHFGDNFRLAFPYRNAEGLITGFLKRSTKPSGSTITTYDNKVHDNVRWDSTPGLVKDDLFGLDKIDNDVDTIIVVEGYPDALYLQALGMSNIAAVGQGKLGKKHLEELRKRKIKNVIIAFDNDDVGPKNTVEAVELIFKNSSITPYVIDPKSYGNGIKDPDEYLIKHGYEMLKNLFDTKAEDGAVWVVKGLISGYNESSSTRKEGDQGECHGLPFLG